MALTFGTGGPKVGDMVSSFREVVALWKTSDALAAEVGLTSSAVRKWSRRDSIPPEWWLPILGTETARAAGLSSEIFAQLAAREPTEARA